MYWYLSPTTVILYFVYCNLHNATDCITKTLNSISSSDGKYLPCNESHTHWWQQFPIQISSSFNPKYIYKKQTMTWHDMIDLEYTLCIVTIASEVLIQRCAVITNNTIVVVVVTLFPANYTKHNNVTYIISYLCSNTCVFIIFVISFSNNLPGATREAIMLILLVAQYCTEPHNRELRSYVRLGTSKESPYSITFLSISKAI